MTRPVASLAATLLAVAMSPAIARGQEAPPDDPAPAPAEAADPEDAGESGASPMGTDASPPSDASAAQNAAPSGEEAPFKKIGFGGVPALNYNTDEGFGYGVIGRIYWYDKEKMAIQPYSKALTLRIFLTTKWLQSHLIELDALDVADLPLRVRARAVYYTTLTENFCGDAATPDCDPALAQAAAAQAYGLDPEDPALDTLTEEQTAGYDDILRQYYRVRYREPYAWLDTRTKLTELPNKLELMASWRGSYYLQGTGKEPTPYPDSYYESYAQAHPDLEGGGLASVVQVGLMLDNRDFEPDPIKGYWLEGSVRASSRFIGSQWDYLGANLTLRGYLPVAPGGRLVLADRIILDGQWGDMPVAEMVRYGGSQIFTGWGGQYAGRGIRSQRYLGRVKASNQAELRWDIGGVNAGTQRFDFGALAFSDLGYVAYDWEDVGGGDEEALLTGVGAGLRVAWNRNFIIRVDAGFSPIEDWGPRVYVNLDHIF